MNRVQRTTVSLVLAALIGGGFAQAAQDKPAGDEQPFDLRVTASSVNIRSHADLNSRVVLRVPEDTILRGLAHEGDWFRIEPPEGVFSYVSADYIARDPGSAFGTVNVSTGTLRVRVGSAVLKLNPNRAAVQTRLERGARVEIVGEEDGWFQILPPPGVHFYVSADHAKPVGAAEAARLEERQPRPLPPTPVATPDASDDADEPATTNNDPLPPAREPVIAGVPLSDGTMPDLPERPTVREEPVRITRTTAPDDADEDDEQETTAAARSDETSSSDGTARPDPPGETWIVRTDPFGQPMNPLPPVSTGGGRDRPTTATESANPTGPATVSTPTRPATSGGTVPPPPAQGTTPVTTARNGTVTDTGTSRIPGTAGTDVSGGGVPAQVPPPARAPGQPLPRFLAEGILQANFSLPLSSQGLRYELQHPYTRRVVAYVEFGPGVQANPSALQNRYVGITGQYFVEPTTRAQIIRVTGVTALPLPAPQPLRSRGPRP